MDIISMGVAASSLTIAKEASQQVKQLTPSYISISSGTGIFDDATFNELIENNLNQLVYEGCYYKLAFKDNSKRRYATDILKDNCLQFLEVNLSSKAYTYSTIPLDDGGQALQDHIDNTTVHTTASEKASWNNKVSCARNGEILEFSV